jgi:hypothetical protein
LKPYIIAQFILIFMLECIEKARMANSQDKLQQGYQITHEVVQRAIANDFDCSIENVKVEDIKKSAGAGKGEGYTCVLFALDITASVNGSEKSLHYMAKCLPAIEHRAKFVTEVKVKVARSH